MNRVLIVEDEASLRLALSDQLYQCASEGVDLEFSKTLDEALARVDTADFLQTVDLVIVDLRLISGTSVDANAGWEVVKRLHERNAELPVIVLTIRNDRGSFNAAVGFGNVRYYITKPWSSSDLIERVGACLSQPSAVTSCEAVGEILG